jgi:hypothetical protein
MEDERVIMRCSRARHLLQLYIDKRLSLKEMRALEAHLSECAVCQQELVFLETIEQALNTIESVKEPPDLTVNIMRRVALSEKRTTELANARAPKEGSFILFRPSLSELIAIVLLATVTTFGVFMQQPALRSFLPLVNGHDQLSPVLMAIWNLLLSVNSNTLMLVFWIFGTILGIWITLLLAGSEMRNLWLKAMIDRLPVW